MNHDDDQAVDFEAQRRHDAEHGAPGAWGPIRSGWTGALARKGPLTDKQIAKYEAAGWYSSDFKAERRRIMDKRKARKREGNFEVGDEGRLIFRP